VQTQVAKEIAGNSLAQTACLETAAIKKIFAACK